MALQGLTLRLRRISIALGRIPSIAYALAYLLAIPAFACIYCCIPNHFFHSTLRYEPAFLDEGDRIRRELKKEMAKKVEAAYGPSVVHEEMEVRNGEFLLHSVRVDGDVLSFALMVVVRKSTSEETRIMGAGVHMPCAPGASISKPETREEVEYRPVEIVWSGWLVPTDTDWEVFPVEKLFPDRQPRLDFGDRELRLGNPKQAMLGLPPSLSQDIVGFAEATRGRAVSVPGRFWRMLYLSAVTITTLGYGDIVPISSVARALLSIEAVGGVILIGLFLNALAVQMGGGMGSERR